MLTEEKKITSTLVPDNQRLDVTEQLFGIHFPLTLEPTVYIFTEKLCPEYTGGYWDFYQLSNQGFYMAWNHDEPVPVYSANDWGGMMSADALSITANLYAMSHLSFSGGNFAQLMSEHFHLLKDFACDHSEARSILSATD